ncbi:MAG: thrombospondin type 3 repeat-containing protein [Bacteroidota bacterium]
MRRVLLTLLALTTLSLQLTMAQDDMADKEMAVSTPSGPSDQKVGITVKALLMDYLSQNGGEFGAFQKYHTGFEFGFNYQLLNQLYVNVPIKVGVVQTEDQIDDLHKSVFSADLRLNYHILSNDNPIVPHIFAGAGYVYERPGTAHIQIPAGLGFHFRLAPRAFLTLQSEYRYALEDDRNNLHHGLGLTYFLGKPEPPKQKEEEKPMLQDDEEEILADSDEDGIVDELDLCPQVAGLEDLDGCPDSDGDGIADYKDGCPEQSGPAALNGCPDSDSDGVSDVEDECPNMAGSISNNGCPDDDADKDGIPNDLDRCPTVAGPASNGGCPELDSDGDGTPDNIDECPNSIGPKNTLGCPDQDGDGVRDNDDRCPSVAGSPANNGCPDDNQDSDGDGVPDNIDKCPLRAGSSLYAGCPDTDGDGVDDSRDACPETPGPASTRGCPRDEEPEPEVLRTIDSDGDGVVDADDRCPGRPGLAVYDGCPDSDGDGLDDSRDRCPNSAGPVDTQGCPEVDPSDRKVLQIAMRAVQFESANSAIKQQSFDVLTQIAEIMERYPDFNLSIEGHTDSQGQASDNLQLSEQRARACYIFLRDSGVSQERMSYAGYGETRPIANNQTVSGRTLNRRVEFALIPRL